MDFAKLTKKSQEALSEAQNKAISYGHADVDGEHLLLALLEQPEGLISRFSPDGADPSLLGQDRTGPHPAGEGHRARVEPGKIRISPRLSRLLLKRRNGRTGEGRIRFRGTSLRILLRRGADHSAGRSWPRRGHRGEIPAALTEVRGRTRVCSDNPESTYEALEK